VLDLNWVYHRSGARYFTAAKKRSSLLAVRLSHPKLRPFCVLPQAARCLLPLPFQKAASDPFVEKGSSFPFDHQDDFSHCCRMFAVMHAA
jgi:hypothetical protein